MLRSLYLRAKRPLQQQLRKMNETALERTEQSLKQQEDGGKLLQQDFLSNIYGPGFHLRRAQIHSSFSAEGQIGDYGCSLEVDTNGNASFEMSETGAAKQFAETQTSEKLQSADHHITLTNG